MKLGFCLLLVLNTLSAFALECDFKSNKQLGQEILDQLNAEPISCSPNPVHLTFNDGPSAKVTPAILKELAIRQVKATFFITTENLSVSENQNIVRKTMDEGHLIANNGHQYGSHSLRMDSDGKILEKGFDQQQREEQIQMSVNLLNKVTNGRYKKQVPLLFRLPYGRGAMPSGRELNEMLKSKEIVLRGSSYAEQLAEYRQISPPLQTLAGNGFSHLGWNIDSRDSFFETTAPDQLQMKEYILKNLQSMCGIPKMTKVALFNNKEVNIEAIPVLIDIGRCMGLNFVSAQELSQDKMLAKTSVLIDKETVKIDTVKQILSGLDNVKKVGAQCEEKKTDS